MLPILLLFTHRDISSTVYLKNLCSQHTTLENRLPQTPEVRLPVWSFPGHHQTMSKPACLEVPVPKWSTSRARLQWGVPHFYLVLWAFCSYRRAELPKLQHLESFEVSSDISRNDGWSAEDLCPPEMAGGDQAGHQMTRFKPLILASVSSITYSISAQLITRCVFRWILLG